MTSRDFQRCCEAVRSVVLATAWLLVRYRFYVYIFTMVQDISCDKSYMIVTCYFIPNLSNISKQRNVSIINPMKRKRESTHNTLHNRLSPHTHTTVLKTTGDDRVTAGDQGPQRRWLTCTLERDSHPRSSILVSIESSLCDFL